MNYRHSYHAGNFADVMKHIFLILLLESLLKKEKSFCYVDTHAGRGYYDLTDVFSQKSKEYESGIEKLKNSNDAPPIIYTYIDIIKRLNHCLLNKEIKWPLRYYPGSCYFARELLRTQDKIIACELEPFEYQTLKHFFQNDKQVNINHLDGFTGLKAYLPPTSRRGLILIDPPYEQPNEFNHLVDALSLGLKRFETGIYAIWFPIKEKYALPSFYRKLKSLGYPVLIAELTIYPDLPQHLNGTGLAILNPPWKFETKAHETLTWLWKTLSVKGQGYYKLHHLQ